MPSGIRITKKVDNFDKLIKASRAAAERLEHKHADALASIMRQIMPVDTGEMKRSTEAVGDALMSRTRWVVKIGVDYWGFVNYGTIYQEGQFFVEQAIDFTRPGFLRDVARFPSFL